VGRKLGGRYVSRRIMNNESGKSVMIKKLERKTIN